MLILVIVSFNYLIGDASVITKLFVFTGYTYGPLLGLYAFGLFSKQKIKDRFVPIIAILTPFVGYAISYCSSLWFGFEFGFFILIFKRASHLPRFSIDSYPTKLRYRPFQMQLDASLKECKDLGFLSLD